MSLVHYKPTNLFGQFDTEINRLFFNADAANQTHDWTPAMDIREQDNRYILEADIPGVSRKDLDITLEDNVLTIKGERTANNTEDNDGYRRRERIHGSFVRQFTLPDTVDTDAISATIENGVLEVGIPKQAKVEPRKIAVK